MRFCCLGSGSRGNGFVAEHGATTLLVDCGFNFSSLVRRLKLRFLEAAEISAVLVSHEHRDHADVRGLEKLRAASGAEIYMTAGTARELNIRGAREIQSGASFAVGDLQILPVTVPHNASEPVQFVVGDGTRRLGIFTDLGHITPAVRNACGELGAIMIECNYSAPLLAANNNYPPHVKDRIAGKYGHLENNTAAAFVGEIKTARLRHVVAVHLSANNNTAALAHEALEKSCEARAIKIAGQETGLDWIRIAA
ncbi:MAG: MBL fold metallo-hydrolase [Gammaproteobacteria bacterium]